MNFTYRGTKYVFGEDCLAAFDARRQRARLSRETGGQLFGRFNADHILIELATVTKGRSRRTRFGFWPDRKAEQADIDALYLQGLHYLGDWHTHPEAEPTPSSTDIGKIAGVYRESRHELQVMFMVIVGLADFPAGIFVGAVRDEKVEQMSLESAEAP